MEGSGDYTVEFTFKGNVDGLKQSANEAKAIVKDTASIGKDFKVTWDGGSGSIKEYDKWLKEAEKQTQSLAEATKSTVLTEKESEQIKERNAKVTEAYNKQVSELQQQTQQTTEDFSGYNNALYATGASMQDLDVKILGLVTALSALEAAFVGSSMKAFAQYEDAMYGMASTVGRAGDTIETAMAGIKQATANGLLSQTDVATAMRNLTAYGYSVKEATNMIEAMTVSAEANRRAGLSVAEAVVMASEGIKRESGLMAKAAGNTQTASSAEEAYATSLGKTASELTNAEKRQAIYNSTMSAGQQFIGIAEQYNNSYSASIQRLDASLEDMRVTFGQALAPIAKWIANAAAWVVANKETIATLSTFTLVLMGGGGVIYGLVKLVGVVKSVVAWFTALHASSKGLIGVLSALALTAAIAATISAINSMSTGLESIAESSGEASDGVDGLTNSVQGAGGAVRNLTEDLEKLRRQYLDELKQIEQRHQETINKLTKQIQEANIDYRRAVEERNAEFAVQQAKEEKSHQEKVDSIMTQIRFLQRYNNEYNRQKLVNLQLALQRETNAYKKQTEAAKAELELQNENDRIAYEEKQAQLKAELDEELAFMNKHREDLKQVQNWILDDEIEALNRRYAEQQKSYEEQAVGAGVGGASVGDSFMKAAKKAIDDNKSSLLEAGLTLGSGFGTSFISKAAGVVDDFFNGMAETAKTIINWVIVEPIKFLRDLIKDPNKVINTGINNWADAMNKAKGYAYGGYTGAGGKDEIAGVVHKGEYVLPQEAVDQTTGTPKSLGNTYNIYVEGVFATSPAERRKVADQIVTAINQNNRSRLEASWQ